MRKSTLLFVVIGFSLGLTVLRVAAQTQTDIVSPAGGEFFGRRVAVLPNGNFVVTDPNYDAPGPLADVGRVYLYDGVTLALLNTMTGGAANDAVGGNGVMVLAGGGYVVSSPAWNGNRGAVTRCSQTTGCPAAISSANSLVGSAADNFVGGNGVAALPNGNYVARSGAWDNGALDVGAITWCNGATGCTGAVSAANSRVGTTAGDQIGLIGIILLSNGNYVTQDVLWDNGAANDAGAVSFCTGTAVCAGAVSSANSLIGTTAGEFTGNQGIFPLTNGNYVVANDGWDNGATMDVGAATFCNGATGCTATVSAANSLIGTTANDRISLDGVRALSNGNYVVRSSIWDNGGTADVGAATFCNGTTGCVNMTVSTSNSLHGSTFADGVAFLRVTALNNGNYVVSNPRWDNVAMSEIDVGASTWCDGTNGCAGPVTPANSLIGGRAGEAIGTNDAVALTNGNYVVVSPNWSGPIMTVGNLGAVTLCNGLSGCPGVEVSPANSLVGSTTNDMVGIATALTNGNYVVTAGLWDNGATVNVGAATFCSGTAGCTGPVTTANSLTGTATENRVGGLSGAFALAGGGYVVRSPNWDNGGTADVGAITRCGAGGCTGSPSPANSLIGSTAGDLLGTDFNIFGVTPLTNGNYIVRSVVWDNGGIVDAGAISYSFGGGGTVGPVTVNNSVRGTTANGGADLNFSFDTVNNQLVVGRPADNIVTVFRPVASPTAADVSVSGYVLTPLGRAPHRASVTLADLDGNSRETTVNRFGYYRFAEVEAGRAYFLSVAAKGYNFTPPTAVVTPNFDVEELNFTAFAAGRN